jgi:hypothetical protein
MEGLYHQGSLQKTDWQPFHSSITADNPKLGAALIVAGRFRNEPVINDQARIIWKLTIYRRFPTVWFVRSHSAGKIIFTTMCCLTGVSVQKIVDGELTEKDFARLTCAAGNLSAAPLRICEISGADQFKESVEALVAEASFSFAVCDWKLEGEDLALAEHFAQTSSLTFLCPR